MENDNNKPPSQQDLREAARKHRGHVLTDISDWTAADIQSLVAELELHQEELRIQNEELQQARDRLESARQIAQNRYRDLFERAPMGYILLDAQGRIQEANRAARHLLAPQGNPLGQPLSAFVSTDSQDALHLHRRALATTGMSEAVDLTLAGDEDVLRIVRMESVVESAPENGTENAAENAAESTVEIAAEAPAARFRCALMDITERRQAQDQLRIAAHVFEDASEAIMVTTSSGCIQSINKAFTRITGYGESDVLGMTLSGLFKSWRHSHVFYKKMWKALNNQGFWQGEIRDRRKNGEVYSAWLSINRIDDDEGQPRNFVAVFADISQLKDSQRKIDYLASHDVLTGLPNRNLLQDRLQLAIAQARRNNRQAALLLLGLDQFKNVNDTLGHDVGDELLVRVATELREHLREVDTVARIGGDEFMVVITDCTPEEAGFIGQRLVANLANSVFEIRGRRVHVTCSAGLAVYPKDGEDADFLSRAADMAMHRAKEEGRNRLRLYEPGLHRRLVEDRVLEQALRRALIKGELRLVYQPQFDACNPERLVGAEALLRWDDPEKGAISPAQFIPIAERSDLIIDLGHRVQELLCKELGGWLAAGLEPPVISLNVSPRAFREEHFASRLRQTMKQYGVSPANLQVEFTEGTLTEHVDSVHQQIRELHEEGIDLAIDDFGTGYSSLLNLKRLPLAELKIDKSFVDGLGENENDEAIAKASLAMARAFGLRTVAEGVETPLQLAWLQEHGCDRIQGFLLARPMEAADFRAML